MKKTTIQILSAILTIGLLSSCNNVDPNSGTTKSTEPVEMVTAEILEKPEESEPQEIERASFSNNDNTIMTKDKEIIYSIKAIVDDLIENGTVIDKSEIQYYNIGMPNVGFSGIAYVDNGNTVKVSWNMTFKTDCEYNVDGNEVIKINAEYYVVSSDTYNELMSLYRQGRATENDSEETEAETQEIERASFKGHDGVKTVTDKELIYNVKAIIDDLLTNGTAVEEKDVLIPSGGFQQSITYVDDGETIRIQLNMRLSPNSEYSVDGNEVVKINAEYYVIDGDAHDELMSLYEQGIATENNGGETNTEPQEIERASFEGSDGTVTVENKEIIYSIKEIIDSEIDNGTIVDKSTIESVGGISEFSLITYVDNGNTIKVKYGMRLKADSEYNVDGNEVIKINAKYYVVSSDTYNELISLYEQGIATENSE